MESVSFSKELIAECQAVFRDENGILLTNVQANECLRGLAGLYRAFAEGGSGQSCRPPYGASRAALAACEVAGVPAPSTGVRNTCGVLQIAP